MTVCCLITATRSDTYAQCTLALDTLRVGFPTAEIDVHVNAISAEKDKELFLRISGIGAKLVATRSTEWHHADWIRAMMQRQDARPLVLVDPDCIFWENCEGFKFPGLIAGMFVPDHWNHWSGCAYRSRLHTSFLWINDPEALCERLKAAFPQGGGEYLPFDPFRPTTVFDFGRPTFYDTIAILCHALPKQEVNVFGPEHLNCYDHLNCASFYHQMMEKWDTEKQKAEFARIYSLAQTNPKELRGLWKSTMAYYDQQAAELVRRLGRSNWNGNTQTQAHTGTITSSNS